MLGKDVFGGSGLRDITRWHYSGPLPALITVTTIFSGSWASAVYESISADAVHDSGITLFVISALLVGNFVVVNLFIAELVNAFVSWEQEQRHQTQLEELRTPRSERLQRNPTPVPTPIPMPYAYSYAYPNPQGLSASSIEKPCWLLKRPSR